MRKGTIIEQKRMIAARRAAKKIGLSAAFKLLVPLLTDGWGGVSGP